MSAEYRRIHREEGNYPIQSMRRWVKASKSGYYAWRNRPESSTTQRREDLTAIIVKFFDESEQTHGCRRIHAEPARSGVKVSLDMVRKIMAAAGPVACQPPETSQDDRAGARPSRPARPAAPRLHRHRARDETGGRHRAWSGPAGIRPPGGRRGLFPGGGVVGRAIAGRMRTGLVTEALAMAVPGPSTDPWCHGPPLGSRSSMHVGRMHGIHDRPRNSPIRRADRQLL